MISLNDEQLRKFLDCGSSREPGLAVAGRRTGPSGFNLSFTHITPIGIEKITTGPEAPLWNELERVCLRAADSLCTRHDIDDELWADLAARLNAKEQMELLFLVGSYTLLAWVLRTVRMPLEDLKG